MIRNHTAYLNCINIKLLDFMLNYIYTFKLDNKYLVLKNVESFNQIFKQNQSK